MKIEAERILTGLNRRLGYADPPDCKYMFIGIEEGGGPCDFNTVSSDGSPLTLWSGTVSRSKKDWSDVYTIMSKIVAGLENISDLETYQTQQMCHSGDFTGLMNLFPLPRKAVKAWPYTELSREQYQEWLFYHQHERYAAMREVLSTMPKLNATICFGAENWQDFINCLNLSCERYAEKGFMRVYPDRRVMLTPFFQYRYGTIDDEHVIPQLVSAVRSFC